ncbi:MAG: deoxyguanosinetriphosphate triphosphohydrolase [Bacteroidales bacterium]|nr:deoxyguanosinetriphosphate triphosphohydrolase [Bacteroidales bacterium]
MEWSKLISIQRLGKATVSTSNTDIRSAFQRDYDRLIFSSAFRRLQNKTQVFPLPGSVFVHNRLTHSLEVASVGRSLANLLVDHILKTDNSTDRTLIEQIPTIVSTACLAHDLGNPPFGHSGEATISEFFIDKESVFKDKMTNTQWADLINFDGNANAFRLLTHTYNGKREGGFGLTFSTLASVVKYPYKAIDSPKRNKFGYFNQDFEAYKNISENLGLKSKDKNMRHPLVYLVEAADDICYQIMDIEDAYKLHILSFQEAFTLLSGFSYFMSADQQENFQKTIDNLNDNNEKIAYLRALSINALVNECIKTFIINETEIMNGLYTGSLLKRISSEASKAMKAIQKISIERIYNHSTVIEIEISGHRIIHSLMEDFTAAVLRPEKFSSEKILNLMPQQYRVSKESSMYDKLLSVVDYISSMTDIYALELYRTIRGISIPKI